LERLSHGSAAAVDVTQRVILHDDQLPAGVDPSVARFSAAVRCSGALSIAADGDDTPAQSHAAAAAAQHVRRRARTQIPVHQAVDGKVEAGVQVRYHRRVQVNGQRQTVRAVVLRITPDAPSHRCVMSELS